MVRRTIAVVVRTRSERGVLSIDEIQGEANRDSCWMRDQGVRDEKKKKDRDRMMKAL